MTKILYLTNEYPPYIYGGAGIHLSNLVEALLSHNSSLCVNVIYNGTKSYTEGERLKVYSIPGNSFDNENNQAEYMTNILDWTRKVMSLNLDFDMVHCHTWTTLLSGVLIKMLSKKPFIITCHSLDLERPWKQEVLQDFYSVTTWIEKIAYQEADAIIAVSTSIKDSLTNYYGISPNKIQVIYNGVDHLSQKADLTLSEAVPGIDNQVPYALFVGRLSKQKGIDYLLNAIKIIDLDIQFVLCLGKADSPRIEEEYLNKISVLRSNGKKIIILRNVYDKQIISSLYENAHIFINPSIYEPFGLTIVEALSHRVPIVSSNIGGPSEILTNGVDSILVSLNCGANKYDINDEQYTLDLANAIMFVLSNDNFREFLKTNAKYTYGHLPTWNQVAKQHCSLYDTVITSHFPASESPLYI